MADIELTTVPRELYYHEVAYVRALEGALRFIAEHKGKTLMSIDYPIGYSEGAQAAFDQMADAALHALRPMERPMDILEKVYYRRGLEAAAQKVEQWAREGGGGAGLVDDRSRNLAEAIRRIDPKTGY